MAMIINQGKILTNKKPNGRAPLTICSKKTHKKPTKIFNSVCPDIIFANNRTDKLTTLDV
jgi:hypothetical protein